jgi:predicted RNA methylase
VCTLSELLALAVALDAKSVAGWSAEEEQAARNLPLLGDGLVREARERILSGHDLLGDLYTSLLSPEERRPLGATYTPQPIVNAMLNWAEGHAHPARIVDPGTGSGRFLVASARRFPNTELVGVESDPIAAILARGHLATHGLAARACVHLRDYRRAGLGRSRGQTLFIGNPPYVRHHQLGADWKAWLVETAAKYGIAASQLAGLHTYFFLATAEYAAPGDVGVFITAAEWLDVNYGNIVRELLLDVLGATNIQVIEPAAEPFPGTATTAVITGFEVGTKPATIGLRRVETTASLGSLETDWHMHRQRFEAARRWSPLTRVAPEKREGFVELGELCRVHRGQVTGANRVWIAGPNSLYLPDQVLYRTVTRARELFATDGMLADDSVLRRVIDIPADLDLLSADDQRAVERYLAYARSEGADLGYVARGRRAWWSVGLRQPAPILATYMARRPPAFVRNLAAARHINIAHGLYPREAFSDAVLNSLTEFLARNVSTTEGRTYAGGLTKFEPREMERLLVPTPELLMQDYATEHVA